jgi:hypothetical protein
VTSLALAVALAGCSAERRQREGREAALRHDLRVLRDGIDQHYADNGRHPASLQALVDALDPFVILIPLADQSTPPLSLRRRW